MASPKQLHSVISDAIEKGRHDIYTCLPAKIISYSTTSQTCTAQPLFQTGEMPMPPIYEVPVIFPAGGGGVITFPVKSGDLCWLMFSMYPMDKIVTGTADTASDNPMHRPHDYNECVAFVGLATTKKNYNPHPSKVMISYGETTLLFSEGKLAELTGDLHVTGKIIATDTITGTDFISSTTNVSFNDHVHHYIWTDPSGEGDTQKAQ